jgi:hypothetical protein
MAGIIEEEMADGKLKMAECDAFAGLASGVCHFDSTHCHPPSGICHLPFAIFNPPLPHASYQVKRHSTGRLPLPRRGL